LRTEIQPEQTNWVNR